MFREEEYRNSNENLDTYLKSRAPSTCCYGFSICERSAARCCSALVKVPSVSPHSDWLLTQSSSFSVNKSWLPWSTAFFSAPSNLFHITISDDVSCAKESASRSIILLAFRNITSRLITTFFTFKLYTLTYSHCNLLIYTTRTSHPTSISFLEVNISMGVTDRPFVGDRITT